MATRTRTFGAGNRESHDASDFYAALHRAEAERRRDRQPVRRRRHDDLRRRPRHARGRRQLRRPGRDLTALLRGQGLRARPRAQATSPRRTSSTSRCCGTCSQNVCASSSRVGGSVSTSPTSAASRIDRWPVTSPRSSRTNSPCSCAVRSSGSRRRARPASCAFGSYMKASNPVLRDLTERVVIASKGRSVVHPI